jgi:hypothetical protein
MHVTTAGVHGPVGEIAKVREMQVGANWFFWVAILAIANSLFVFFSGLSELFFGFGVSRWVDANVTFAAIGETKPAGLVINLVLAAGLAGFGYLTRRGSDTAFIVGMFLYFADSVISLGYRDIFGFSFHILALFFMFKGLLASRRRYDPSVDETGA